MLLSNINGTGKLSGTRRVIESVFILIVLASVFLILSIFSHDGADPSWSQTAVSGEVNNLMGYVGANVSDMLIFLFGYGAILVPLTILYVGFCVFVKKFNIFEIDFFTVGLRILGYVFLVISLQVLMSMNIPNGEFLSGGVVGNILAGFSISYFGEMGTSLLYLALFLSGIPLFTGVSLLLLCDLVGGLFFAIAFHRSYVARRQAELQMQANLETRKNLAGDTEEDDDDHAEPTVFDETTGFAIFLRDDNEIRYEGSYYDDDDYPQLKSEVQSSNNSSKQLETSTVKSTDTDVPKKSGSDLPGANPSESTSDVDSSATNSTSSGMNAEEKKNTFGSVLPDLSITDDQEDLDLAASSLFAHKETGAKDSEVRDYDQVEVGNIDQIRQTMDHSASQAPEDTAVQVDLSNYSSSSVSVSSNSQSISPDSNKADVSARDDSRSLSVQGSVPHSSGRMDNFVDDTSAAIEEAENRDFADDIPDFLPPGQRSVLDDDPDQKDFEVSSDLISREQSDENSLKTDDDLPLQPSLNEEKSQEPKEDIDRYFTSLHETITPSLLQSLRGKYNPHRLPSIELLDPVPAKPSLISDEEIETMSRLIEDRLKDYRISVTVMGAERGPVITRFRLELSPGTKVSKIVSIKADLARVLAVRSVRVVEVIPGTTYVGLEIPNPKRQTVYFRELLDSDAFKSRNDKLTCALGCSVVGAPLAMNLAKTPHLLVAGTTGSGKSVGVNGMILSMLYKSTPDDLRLILIDPKMLEFSSYEGIPHLLTPVVTDMKDATSAIRWCVGEMERRYKLMSKLNVKNFDGYNEKVLKAINSGEPILDPMWERTAQLSDKRPYLGKLPYIVLVIDELADMMMQIGKKVEELIARLAQKARAAGIHMIIATQSPRADVLTGLIKSNIPSRMSFTVSNAMESRIILEQQGAESLLGNGDMLFSPTGSNALRRIHGAFVNSQEIDRIVAFWKMQGEPEYVDKILDDEITDENALPSEKAKVEAKTAPAGRDELFDDAVRIILDTRRASTSVLQSRMGIGYPRASKLIVQLEDAGFISKALNDAGKRQILVDESYFDQ